MIKLSPSILTADFCDLGNELKKIEDNGCPYVHIDVMDGQFVPNISIGIPVVKSIRNATDMVLDVHLMIKNPLKYIEDFAKAGSDIINFHIESDDDPNKVIDEILRHGKKAGITLKPDTDVNKILPYIDRLSLVLIMSVEPGFGGQSFMPEMMEKVKFIKDYADKNSLELDIEVDGGVNMTTIETVLDAGANVVVVGSGIYNKDGADKNTRKYIEFFEGYSKKWEL